MIERASRGLAAAFFMIQGLAVAWDEWFPGSSSIRESETIPSAFRGNWAPDPEHCGDPDGVSRIQILAHGIDTYESGGRLERITQAGRERAVRVKLAFEGEGRFWESIETWVLDAGGNRLTISPANSQGPIAYVRCG